MNNKNTVLALILLILSLSNQLLVCGSNLFLYTSREIGLIPVDLDGDNIYVRIWEEDLKIGVQSDEINDECLYIGKDLNCDNLMCGDSNNIEYKNKNINRVCNFKIFKPKELNIPTFIESDFPLCKIYNLEDVAEFKNEARNFYHNNLNVCKCLGKNNTKIFSPQMLSNNSNINAGWKLDVIERTNVIPEIYPSNRYIINVRVLVNPGWNFEFALIYKSTNNKLNDHSYSIISFKKDINCYGFPEDESLKIIQSFVFFKYNNYFYQKFSWKSPNLNENTNKFDFKYPINELATTHYYICYYPHYNLNSGHNLGSIYFRLDPEDAAKTFSLFVLIASITPMVIFFLYIIIGTKHKTSIDKLQGFILLENRNNVSLKFFIVDFF
ncbi:hypothetical protein RS030_3458 [Cryptosporidium xiaoi]|uniref:Uncharacterized protein n=1 Tax=Cryptosporidium xiaoi TaxID=659607 RepID=A0AAV9XYM0_9CRYT